MRFDEECGWWFPDHEAHLQYWMTTVQDRHPAGRLLYQGKKYRLAMQHVKQHRLALDIGGHVGLWSWQMAHDFREVQAFEPMPEHAACWHQNLVGLDNVVIHECALGTEPGEAMIRTRTPDSSGDTGIEFDGEGVRVELLTLDSFELDNVDFIKIDCEGYELFVLQGAEETLLRCKPTIIVEQKPETGGAQKYDIDEIAAVTYLQSLGAIKRAGLQGDYVLSWD